jgi:hypothetical protein
MWPWRFWWNCSCPRVYSKIFASGLLILFSLQSSRNSGVPLRCINLLNASVCVSQRYLVLAAGQTRSLLSIGNRRVIRWTFISDATVVV